MKNLLFPLLLLLALNGFSQKENNIWYFGETCGLDFNFRPIKTIFNSVMTVADTYACISDASGNLLFYTNAYQVWNKQHQLMDNGSIALESPTIIPFGNNSSQYCIIGYIGENLSYAIVDMSLNNGLGKVIQKNTLIKSNMALMFGAVRHQNGRDIWIISKENYPSTTINVFLMTNTGISGSPMTTTSTCFSIGTSIVSSLDGTKICMFGCVLGGLNQSEASIWNFDRSTGKLSHDLTLDFKAYGIMNTIDCSSNAIFSPDKTKLYLSPYQFNLNAGSVASIINSRVNIYPNYTDYSGIQVMPDGKIYVFKFDETTLDVINYPNNLGTACGYQKDAIDLKGKKCFGAFPKYLVPFDINSLEIFCITNCTQNASFSISSSKTIIYYQWNFGDGTTSTELNPSHTYTNSGTYTVQVLVTYEDATSQSLTKSITIIEKPKTLTINHK